jgi:hypothetical protein
MAPNDENAMGMQRLEDSCLRQLWRLPHTLIKVRNGALTHKDVKNEDRPGDVYENKGEGDKMDDNRSGFVAENAKVGRKFGAKPACFRNERRLSTCAAASEAPPSGSPQSRPSVLRNPP